MKQIVEKIDEDGYNIEWHLYPLRRCHRHVRPKRYPGQHHHHLRQRQCFQALWNHRHSHPGGVASGSSFINWGWVLTPQPNSLATDGSNISVYVDGVKAGNPVYNIFREDIATFFPGYANSFGAVGYFVLDTTRYPDGIHSIQWVATDSAGNTDGIGSRYFLIDNSGGSGSDKEE